MRILIVLTYYRPHISGLTIYAERIARAFAQRGHQVTVLTSQFDPQLPREEVCEGVRVIRVPVLMRLSKGVIMPSFGRLASKLVRENDVLQLHLPQFDAAGVALRGRLHRKPTIITYHCDLELPPGLFNRIANLAVLAMNELAAIFTHRIVTYTHDYADHSKYTRRHIKKVNVIPPPVVLPAINADAKQAFKLTYNPQGKRPVIGMAARFATEKGVEVLLKAMPAVLEKYPNALFQFVGPYQNIIGEESYYERLQEDLRKYEQLGSWQFLGSMSPAQMSAFYANLDLLIVPSLNSTEAFGLVQIEAMMNGVRCITSDLPGVRMPVKIHHMGEIFPIGDDRALARLIIETLSREDWKKEANMDFSLYDPDAVAAQYETLFAEINQKIR
ncbi:MAG TPA: glycosyltransferase family 4 protein [Anaerolineaceae bacterium]|nr:glycosyltransferase family 4 protein [Anaerolineaceae bacterium]